MSVTADPRIDSELAGYRIESLLGSGGMSDVYLAEDLTLGRKVALKLMSAELSEDESFRERFRAEWRLAASIDHPNVIPIYEAGDYEGTLFIAMRFVEGTDLKALLASEGALEPARALNLLSQAAAGLDAAHDRGLVHRDVKPSNLLIAFDKDGEHAYLADFGLTKPASTPDEAQASIQLSGSTDYVSPEQIADGNAEAASDIYSLGALLYECLTGEIPFPRDSQLQAVFAHLNDPPPKATDVDPDLPEAIDGVIATAMAKAPEERYAAGAELAAATSAAFPEHRRRWPLAALLAVIAAVIAAAIVAAILLVASGDDGGSAFAPVQVDSLVRIDPETNQATTAIVVDPDPSAVAVGEGAVWVASGDTGRVLRIDPERNDVTGRYQADERPVNGLAAGEGGVWTTFGRKFSGRGMSEGEPTVQRLDPRTREFSLVDPRPRIEWEEYCCLVVGEGAVWVSDVPWHGQVLRVDAETGEITTISEGYVDHGPDGTRGIGGIAIGEGAVWTFDENGLRRIDPASNEVELVADFAFQKEAIAAGAGAVWIVDPGADSVLRIDPVDGSATDAIKVGTDVTGIAVGESSVWVGNGADGTVSRIDPERREVVATIDVGGSPEDIAIGEGGVWVTVSPQ